MHTKPLDSFEIKQRLKFSSEPDKIVIPSNDDPPCSPYAVKMTRTRRVEKQGARPYRDYDYVNSCWVIRFDTAVEVSAEWHKFESLSAVIRFCHHSFEKPFKASQKQLLALPAHAIDGVRVSGGRFISAVVSSIVGYDIDVCSFFGIDQFSYNEVGLSFNQSSGIFEINNPPNAAAFFDYLEAADAGHELVTLYHGTWRTNVPLILRNDIKASTRGALGRGVYLGQRDKAFTFSTKPRYSSISSRDTHRASRNDSETRRVIFECDVILRDVEKITEIKYSGDSYAGRDAYTSQFRRPEWCVRDPARVLIKRIHLTV